MSFISRVSNNCERTCRNMFAKGSVFIGNDVPNAAKLNKISDIIGGCCFQHNVVADFASEGDKMVLSISPKSILNSSSQDTISAAYTELLNKDLKELTRKYTIDTKNHMLKQIFTAIADYTKPKN